MRHFAGKLRLIPLFLLALALSAGCGGSKLKLPVSRDTVIWMYRGEPTFNFGAVEPLWAEGAHYAALIDFDMSALRGRRVSQARLWLHKAGDTPLYAVALSTIAADWIEGAGDGSAPQPDASCAAWVRQDPQSGRPVRWAGPGSDFTDVIMGEGGSLRSGELTVKQESGGWQSVEVPNDFLHALAVGAAYGIVIVDARGELRTPDGNFIRKMFNSRGSGETSPYLEVELEKAPEAAPVAPTEVRVLPEPLEAGVTSGAALVEITPQGEGESRGFVYEVLCSSSALDTATADSAARLPRWQVPPVSAQGRDTVRLSDLTPGAPLNAAVRTVDRSGRASAWVLASGEASAALAWPSLVPPRRPDLGGRIRVWACGPDEKVNPVTGRLFEENAALYGLAGDGDYDYKFAGPLWEAASNGGTVSLDAPRGGTAAFQVLVEPEEAALEGLSLRADWIDNPAGVRSRFPAKVFRLWSLRDRASGQWFPEVAVPQTAEFNLPDTANGIPGQRNQAFLVEYYIPRDAAPGRYRAAVVVGARGLLARSLEVEITVHRAVLPDVLPFIAEMNVYSPVAAQWGLDPESDEYYSMEEKYYRLAHEHLAAINQLPYSQNGSIKAVGAPKVEGEGENIQVSDWSAWDNRWGRYLDGSAFDGTDRRAAVPVMYLPFFENWPSGLNRHFRFTPRDTTYPEIINERALDTPAEMADCFDPAYAAEWTGALRQFARHFREKGWTGTEFQLYLNNKYYWKDPKMGDLGGSGISWWLLDEPYHWDDFKAIAYYGNLFMQAVGEVHDVNMVFRLDVSRPQLQFGLWDGIRSVSYVSGAFYEKNAFLLRRQREFGEKTRNYGAFNNLDETNLTATAWPLKVWLAGGSGLLPWQTIGDDKNFGQFQNTAIFYLGRRFGVEGPLASLRLKACRLGVENTVLLELLARSRGWTREQAALAVSRYLDLGGGTREQYLDDAGQVNFAGLDRAGLTALRRAVLRSLD
ncbi:hypothetical protein LLH00_16585 [bacterium]|nr:hypothetical protein [bacterium]